jgi:hypothetical protein
MDSNEPVTMSDLPADRSYENRIGHQGVTVPGTTICDLVKTLGLPRIDFLMMNIEGAETAALRGAADCFDLVGAAAISCHDFLADRTGDDSYRTKDEVRALLLGAGFKVTTQDAGPRPWAPDYLFASREPQTASSS